MRWLLVAVGLLAACGDNVVPEVVVYAPAQLAPGARDAVDDLVHDLAALTGQPVQRASLPAPGCRDLALRVVVLGHEHDASGAPATTPLAREEYTIDEVRCVRGHTVTLRGGSLLAGQWAIYDLLERLGVRRFHPERTVIPASPRWPDEPLAVDARPSFARRSMHAHTTHPIELSPPLGAFPGMADYQKHWIAWNVALRQTEVDGWDDDVVGDYAFRRGFPRTAGLNLVESQQGGRPVIDPSDPRPESAQMAEAIDVQLAPVPGRPDVSSLGFVFNPSEFTVADEQRTLDRIDFVTSYVGARWPGVEVSTINHGTGQPPGPTFGIRFFDIPQLAPPALGVSVHPLMFYDLDRPAPVYGNRDFRFLRDWLVREQARRRITYYPESSWWLTFDLPVPLFLAPVTLEARDHDLALLRPYVTGDPAASHGVVGHELFTSGQEWGYWMIDYCTAHMAWDIELGWLGCLDHIASAFEHGDRLRAVLEEVGRAQVDPMRDPAILAMLVGSDDQTEAAALAGIVFHPLPPAPASVLGLSDEQAAALRAASVDPLPAMAARYAGWADKVAALADAQDAARAPWIREIADGLRITGLRARHAWEVHDAALALRAAIRASDFAAVGAAAARVPAARGWTEAARAIVTGREAEYRYPEALTIAGDEAGTPGAIANRTTYPYRYLSRVHRMFYWQRPDDQLAAMTGADLSLVTVSDRMLHPGAPLTVGVLASQVAFLAVDWGDGATAGSLAPHSYGAQGVFDWTLDVVHAGGAIHWIDRAAIVDRRLDFARGALSVTSPPGGAILAGLLPGFAIGLGSDAGGEFLAIGRVDGDDGAIARGTVQRRARSGASSGPADLPVELARFGRITVYGALITVADGTGASDRRLAITGELAVDEIVQLLVQTGAFDADGARSIVAATLGYTVATLPARIAFRIEATGRER